MRSFRWFLVGYAAIAAAQTRPPVDFEMMTWPEVKHALESGRTTALIYNGGTEQRGPQNVNGGHTLMGHATVLAVAEKLGNAIVAPVLPYSVNNASAALPGTIGITAPLFAAINEQVAEQLIVDGFRNVVLMGDHGGGQRELAAVAKKLAARYAAKGVRVVYCGDVYENANRDFDKWLAANGYPASSHAGSRTPPRCCISEATRDGCARKKFRAPWAAITASPEMRGAPRRSWGNVFST